MTSETTGLGELNEEYSLVDDPSRYTRTTSRIAPSGCIGNMLHCTVHEMVCSQLDIGVSQHCLEPCAVARLRNFACSVRADRLSQIALKAVEVAMSVSFREI